MNYQQLGDRVKKLRKSLKMSQIDLAVEIGVDARTIVAIEAGKRNPTLKTINKLARALKIPVHELLRF